MDENILWWIVFIITIICMVSIPALLQMLWEEFKKNKDDKQNNNIIFTTNSWL